MELNDIKAEFEAWRNQPELRREMNLLARAKALDFLHFVRSIVPEMIDPPDLKARFVVEVAQLVAALTAIDQRLFAHVRDAIGAGQLRGAALRAYLMQFAAADPVSGENMGIHTSYGAVDLLVDGIFALQSAPAPSLTPTAEMVHCEETPALAILDLVDQLDVGPADRFYDLGCGLGQVTMLVHLLTGVTARGVEIEPSFVAFARQQAGALKLPAVHFLNGDAQTAPYDDGTIFFLFTPFRGAMLRRVLARLQTIARDHPIRVCTFGPCTPIVAVESWLRPRRNEIPHEFKLAIFDSQPPVIP